MQWRKLLMGGGAAIGAAAAFNHLASLVERQPGDVNGAVRGQIDAPIGTDEMFTGNLLSA